MPAKVIFEVVKGALQGWRFDFDERAVCIVGRSDDCNPRLPDDKDHVTISRHHCLLDINPPDVRARDFGSLNGTRVNRQIIGQREKGMTPEQGAAMSFPEQDLKTGDEIELGGTTFRVEVLIPPHCPRCSAELPDEQARCEACAGPNATVPAETPEEMTAACARCGRDVTGEMGEGRVGEILCTACQADPARLVHGLLAQSGPGGEGPVAVQGHEIVKELGRGGMGAVFLARRTATGESVALKVMLPKVAVNARSREMFLREAENTRALRHPNVVRFHEFDFSEGAFYFTLEYCEGGSVEQLLRRRGGTLTVDEAARIVLQALDGLEYAHNAEIPNVRLADGSIGKGRGLVHRDLKPSNLFLSGPDGSDVVKIGDFGLAKSFDLAGLSGQTRTGSAAGTPVFMPRQQVVNFKYAKPDVDVWSMAATLYHLLTGAFPRDFPNNKDPWQQVLQSTSVPIRERSPVVPTRLAEVIDQALVDRPTITFKSAAKFRQALVSVL